MRATGVLSGVVLLIGASLALGQDYFWGGYPSYHASTPAEGYARGMADVARSAGQRNLSNSEAAINWTEAQSRYIDNRDKATNTYFQMREANRQYRAAQRAPRPSMESLVRFAQAGKPQRLSPSELDVVTGEISWPEVLLTDPFSENRKQVEQLFAKRAEEGTLGYDDQTQLREATDAMLADLMEFLRDQKVKQMDYVAAKRFLESLAYGGVLPVT